MGPKLVWGWDLSQNFGRSGRLTAWKIEESQLVAVQNSIADKLNSNQCNDVGDMKSQFHYDAGYCQRPYGPKRQGMRGGNRELDRLCE